MFCPKCGQQNPDEAKFCGKCGAAVSAAAQPQPQPQPQPFQNTPQPAKDTGAITSGMKNGMIAASIILPIVGIVVGIIYLLDANPEKKEAGKLWLIIGIVAAVVWTALFGA
jgi:uncharacterized membrane protein YvbJ